MPVYKDEKRGTWYVDKDPMSEDLFIERCESIMATENGTWAQLNEKKRPRPVGADQGPRTE